MFNSFGSIYRFTSFGESHGAGTGVVIDGCPAGLTLDMDHILSELSRRRPGGNQLGTSRNEADIPEVLSGLFDGTTTGAPIAFFVRNRDVRSTDYDHLEKAFRPSHGDYTYFKKYGIRDHRGGGRSSAREMIARVIAGAIAKQYLMQEHQVEIKGWIHSVGDLSLNDYPEKITLSTEDQQLLACPDASLAKKMIAAIEEARAAGDSLGGVIGCRAAGVTAGWGEPIYDKLEARLAAAMLGINAVKGFEIGSGFSGTRMKGSEHNDPFISDAEGIRTTSNHAGGVLAGISSGEDIRFKVAFKPTSTIMKPQQSVDEKGTEIVLEGKGRHDPCVLPRALPVVEAMTAVTLMDFALLNQTRRLT